MNNDSNIYAQNTHRHKHEQNNTTACIPSFLLPLAPPLTPHRGGRSVPQGFKLQHQHGSSTFNGQYRWGSRVMPVRSADLTHLEIGPAYPSVRRILPPVLRDGTESVAHLLEDLPLLDELPVHVIVKKHLDKAVWRIEPSHQLFEDHHPPKRGHLRMKQCTRKCAKWRAGTGDRGCAGEGRETSATTLSIPPARHSGAAFPRCMGSTCPPG